MDFKGALLARAIDDGAVAAFIADRAYWTQRVQGEGLPAVVFQLISDPRPQHLKGFDDLRETRVQADCLALSSQGASNLAEALIAALVPATTANGILFNRAIVDVVRDLDDRSTSTQADTAFVHRTSIDLRFWWQSE